MTDTSGLRRRTRTALAATAAAALLATTAGLWATDTWPFRETYCWGAWQEGDDGIFFDEEEFAGEQDAERLSEQSPPPTSGRPEGTCEVTVAWRRKDGERRSASISAAYGRPPAGEADHRAWLDRYLHGTTSALPDGLDGVVAKDRALLVLPAGCDVGGRPTVVTPSSADAEEAPRILADMLVDLANTAMRTAGCAPGEPLARTSPIDGLHRRDFTSPPDRACGIPGVHFSDSPATSNDQYASVHGDRYQTCSVVRTSPRRPAEPVGHYVMVGTPAWWPCSRGCPRGPHGVWSAGLRRAADALLRRSAEGGRDGRPRRRGGLRPLRGVRRQARRLRGRGEA